MPQARIEVLDAVRDARGLLFEPVDDTLLAAQKNAHVVLFAPGAVRGNHRHVRGTEVNVVVGPALVRLREDGRLRDLSVPAGEVWRITIPPGVAHAYRNPGPDTLVMVAFNSEIHDPAQPDTVRDPILDP